LIVPGDAGYDDARRVFNGLVDRRPALIARCRGTADVVRALGYARTAGLPVAVRGGGHSVAGHGTCDGGVLLDLSTQRGVWVDPARRTVRVQAGATLGDVDRETQCFGLAVPTGQVAATGIAGLTLGGGVGMLLRRFGLTCDNLLSAELVTAAGELVTAGGDDAVPGGDPELLWALRGGGGNFGVVTSFEFRLHPVGPLVYGGTVSYPAALAGRVVRAVRDAVEDGPDELTADVIFRRAPAVAAVPAEFRGEHVVSVFARYCGEPGRGEELVRPLRRLGPPVLDSIRPMSYVGIQSLLDPPRRVRTLHYWTGEYLPALGGPQIAALTRYGTALPGSLSTIQVMPFNGAATRVPADATAYAHRSDSWLVHVLGQWASPADTERGRRWAKDAGSALRAVGCGDSYLNLLTDEEGQDRVRAGWPPAHRRRLARVKATYDPDNVFRFNHNITPAT
jgi:FAD/FMN-containing dehydrogenase